MERQSDRSEQRGEYEAPAPGMCRAGTQGDARDGTRGIPGTGDKGQARLRGGPHKQVPCSGWNTEPLAPGKVESGSGKRNKN